MLVIQIVEILWTKATRGAPRSNERANLPRAFPIGNAVGNVTIQRFRIAEWEDFSPALIKVDQLSSPPTTVDVLRISRRADGSLTLGITGTPGSGQPRRRAIPEAFTLEMGQYARLTLNSRHASYSGQYYSELVYHVAFGEHVHGDRFILGKPEHEFDLRVNLF